MNYQCPLSIYRHLHCISRNFTDFAYLELSEHHHVIKQGGKLSQYGLDELDPNRSVSEQFLPLAGMLPISENTEVLLNVTITDNQSIDIHVYNNQSSYWVFLVDSTKDAKKLQAIRQQRVDKQLLTHARVRKEG